MTGVDAVRGEVYTATRGGGAFRDGAPIACADATDLATALVGTGFAYDAERRREQGAVVAGLLPHVRDIRRLGAAAVDTEAGADLSSLDGGPVEAGSVIAAPSALATPLRELLRSLSAQNVS